jgi:hypothetical protein
MSFKSVMDKIGHDCLVGLDDVEKYLPGVTTIAEDYFPASEAVLGPVNIALTLIQKTATAIEQKFATASAATGTGAQKAAEVLSIAGPAVTALLAAAKVKTPPAVPALIDAVVADLNTKAAPAAVDATIKAAAEAATEIDPSAAPAIAKDAATVETVVDVAEAAASVVTGV